MWGGLIRCGYAIITMHDLSVECVGNAGEAVGALCVSQDEGASARVLRNPQHTGERVVHGRPVRTSEIYSTFIMNVMRWTRGLTVQTAQHCCKPQILTHTLSYRSHLAHFHTPHTHRLYTQTCTIYSNRKWLFLSKVCAFMKHYQKSAFTKHHQSSWHLLEHCRRKPSHCKLLGPLLGCLDVLGLVWLVLPRNVWYQRVIGVGICEKRADG